MNDLVTFDASGLINGGKPLFDDTGIDGEGHELPGNVFHNSSAARTARAFLIVDNNDTSGISRIRLKQAFMARQW